MQVSSNKKGTPQKNKIAFLYLNDYYSPFYNFQGIQIQKWFLKLSSDHNQF